MPSLSEARNLTTCPDLLTPSDRYRQMMRRQGPWATARYLKKQGYTLNETLVTLGFRPKYAH